MQYSGLQNEGPTPGVLVVFYPQGLSDSSPCLALLPGFQVTITQGHLVQPVVVVLLSPWKPNCYLERWEQGLQWH